MLIVWQRLMGASLLVFKNKSDVAGSMTEDEVREVRQDKRFFAAGDALADRANPRDSISTTSKHTSGPSWRAVP